jgi:hypothetical protein
VVDADGQVFVFGQPEVVEEQLGLRAGVVEDQRGAVARDLVQDRRDGVAPAAARSRGAGWRFPAWRCRGRGRGRLRRMAVRGQGSGRGRAGLPPWRTGRRGAGRGPGLQAGEAGASSWSPRLDSARAWISSMMTRCRPWKDARGVFVAEEQGEAFGRGQQDMRRVGALAAALGVGGVAGAVLDPDRRPAPSMGGQVAADVGGQRLEGRDVEGVQAGGRGRAKFGQVGRNPASVLPPPVGAMSRVAGSLARPAWPAGGGAASSLWRRTSRTGRGEAAVMAPRDRALRGFGEPWRARLGRIAR